MTQDVQEILRALKQYEDTPESWGLELRLNVAEIIISALKRKGWRQGDLAREASMKESFISRVLHSNANCTLDTVARLFHALGVNAHMTEVAPLGVSSRLHNAASEIQILNREETCDAPCISTSEGSTRKESWQVQQANTGA